MWAQYDAYLTAMRDVLGLRLPVHEKYASLEMAAIHGGYRYMHPQFCMVSDFPEFIHKDARHRPHCEDGPSHRWRDGWSLYYWHGVAVDEQIIMRPETLTASQVLAETNSAVRGVMLARRPLLLMQMEGVKTLHEDTVNLDPINPPPGLLPRLAAEIEEYVATHPRPASMTRRLIQVPMPDHEDGSIKAIIFEDPAEGGAMGVLLAHRDSKTCQDAVARSYNLSVKEYPAETERHRR